MVRWLVNLKYGNLSHHLDTVCNVSWKPSSAVLNHLCMYVCTPQKNPYGYTVRPAREELWHMRGAERKLTKNNMCSPLTFYIFLPVGYYPVPKCKSFISIRQSPINCPRFLLGWLLGGQKTIFYLRWSDDPFSQMIAYHVTIFISSLGQLDFIWFKCMPSSCSYETQYKYCTF